MTNPSPGLPHPVRRVSPTSPNSAAITSSMLPIPMRRVIPDRRTGSELLRLPRTARRVSRTVQTNAASRPGLYQPVRRVILLPPLRERVPTASPTSTASFPNCPNQCGESSRIVPTSAASPPRPPRRERASLAFPNCPTNAASRPPTAKQCGELLRLSRTVQTYAASYSPRIATSSAASYSPKVTQFAELCSEQKQHSTHHR